MEEPKIAQKKPFILQTEPKTYAWCACGRSKKQPFCDGSHKGSEFKPIIVKITEAKKIAWCDCKHSKNAPFCDGTHLKL